MTPRVFNIYDVYINIQRKQLPLRLLILNWIRTTDARREPNPTDQ